MPKTSFFANKKLILIGIIILASVLRVFDFGQNPAGLYLDEASHGYDAYSLLTTGKDEFGKAWPILLRSFGTYPPALYSYLTTVPIHFFGLNVVAVRLTSLISGLLLVILVAAWVGPVFGLIIAVSPVFIFLSRAAFEPNLGLLLIVLGSILAFRKKFFLSFFVLALSSFAYPSERFLAPLCVIYFLIRSKKAALPALAVFIVASLPLWLVSLTSGASARLRNLSVSNPGDFIRLTAAYFYPANLFWHPDPDIQRSFPDLSVFYWWFIIPFFIGLYTSVVRLGQLSEKHKYLILIGLVSLIPGGITTDYFSTLRVLPFFLLVSWIICQGAKTIYNHFRAIYLLIIILAIIDLYPALVFLKHERSVVWNYPYAGLSQYLGGTSRPVVVDNSRVAPSYILLAFYLAVPSREIQSQFDSPWVSHYYSHPEFVSPHLGQIYFHPIDWSVDTYKPQLLVGDALSVSQNQIKEHYLHQTATISDINGQPILFIYQTNPSALCHAEKLAHLPPNPLCLGQL